MAKSLNFKKVNKSYLPITFNDENGTTIFVGTPTKALMDEFISYQEKIDNAEGEGLNELYEMCSKLMSRNKTGAKITREYLETVFDMEDIKIFFHAYIDFMSEIINSKN